MFQSSDLKGKKSIYPKHNIDPNDKDKKWHKEFAQAAYTDYINNRTAVPFSSRDDIWNLRRYAEGNQPTEKYMDRLAPKDPNTGKRKGYMNVSWAILSVVPKFRRVCMGMFKKMDYNVYLNAIDEKSSSEKEKMKWSLWASKQLQEELGVEIGMSGSPAGINFMPDTIEELEMLSRIGSFKLATEIAMEKALDWSFYMSSWNTIKERLFEDWWDIGIAGTKDYVCKSTGYVKCRYVDPEVAILSYSKDPTYQNMRIAGEVIKMKIADLREQAPDLTEEEITHIIDQYDGFHRGSGEYRFEDMEYEDFDIQVVDLEFFDYDVENYEEKKRGSQSYVFKKDYKYSKKSNANRKHHQIKRKTVRKVKWVVGTDIVYDWGYQNDIPRPNDAEAKLSFHFYRESNQSILASIIPLVDNIQLTWLKLQNAVAMAAPSGLKVEAGSLTNVQIGGNKMNPLEILSMYRATGDVIYKATTHHSEYLGSTAAPVDRIVGGVGPELNEFVSIINHNIEMIRQITGISPAMDASTLNTEVPVGTSKMQVGATSNVMHNIFNGYQWIKEDTAKNMVLRWQIQCRYRRIKGDYTALGKTTMEVIKLSSEHSMMNLGIKTEMMPTEEQINEVKQLALQSYQGRKSGAVGISGSDYMYIVQLLEDGNWKQAQMYLSFKELKDQERADQIQMQLEQQRQEGAMVLNQQKTQGKMQEVEFTENAKGQREISVEKVKSDLRDKERGNKAFHDDVSQEKKHYQSLDENLIKEGNKTLGIKE